MGGKALHVEQWPPVGGRPGITQGMYGRGGNLELVAPAVDDGLWVGWFNCDPDDDFTGAQVGQWSGALRFARGRRYVSADVTQAPDGSLETVALDVDGNLVRHVWTAAGGYTERRVIATGVASHAPVVFEGRAASVGYRDRAGATWVVALEMGEAAQVPPTPVDPSVQEVVDRLRLEEAATSAAWSTVGGQHRLEVAVLDGDRVRHIRSADGSVMSDAVVEARVWVDAAVETCHRGL